MAGKGLGVMKEGGEEGRKAEEKRSITAAAAILGGPQREKDRGSGGGE